MNARRRPAMSSEQARDEDFRRLATDVINELLESLRAANAESVERGHQLMEERVGDRPKPHESAYQVWGRLEGDEAVLVQGDYALLRTGLGRRVSPGGPPIDAALRFETTEDGLRVRGRGLSRSIGLVVRWTDEDGNPLESVHPHTLGEASHLIPYDEEFGESALRVISFDTTSITGFGVWSPILIDITLTSE
jgi:hypothetical protein